MGDVLQDLSPPALVKAIEENWYEVFRLFRCWPQAEVYDGPDLLWTITDVPFAMFNHVLRTQLEPEAVDAAVEAAITRCRSRNVPLRWHIGPTTRPANLGEVLQAHGFTGSARDASGLAVDLLALNEDLPAPPGLTIEHVTDVETLKQSCQVVSRHVFEWPDYAVDALLDYHLSVGLDAQSPQRCYVGRLRGELVAKSDLVLGAGVAGLYGVATVPQARRQGIGTAMTLAALREARALGYRVGILHTGARNKNALRVYRRIGFREYCKLGSYKWTGEPKQDEGA